MTSEWIWFIFIFAFGACIGSFLNVVIYRLPRDKSLVTPPSACPGCEKNIVFYDNIPLLSWLILRGRCRNCKMKISVRYFIVELIMALIFLAVFILYFVVTPPVRSIEVDGGVGLEAFVNGGWLMYVAHVLLLASLLAASGIDIELMVIPLSICWFGTLVGLVCSSVGGFFIDPAVIRHFDLLPMASTKTGMIAVGSAVGLIFSLIGLKSGIIKRSYEADILADDETEYPSQQPGFPHRREVLKEVVFLMPIMVGAVVASMLLDRLPGLADWWVDFSQTSVVSGLLGSFYGYLIGCAVVWGTRILGTIGFGKEAMGLGDVHLMGAAGAVIGYKLIIVAFFVAPFFGLAWALYQAIFKKTRQIPYGPFLSMGVFAVMIYHDRVIDYLSKLYMLN